MSINNSFGFASITPTRQYLLVTQCYRECKYMSIHINTIISQVDPDFGGQACPRIFRIREFSKMVCPYPCPWPSFQIISCPRLHFLWCPSPRTRADKGVLVHRPLSVPDSHDWELNFWRVRILVYLCFYRIIYIIVVHYNVIIHVIHIYTMKKLALRKLFD